MFNAAILCDSDRHKAVYHPVMRQEVEKRCKLFASALDRKSLLDHASDLSGLRYVWTTWQAPLLEADDLRHFPQLEVVFSATGTVKRFARPFLENGVRVVSAKAMNARPVAEFCVGHILLAGKGYQENRRNYTARSEFLAKGIGNYGLQVGLIGCGTIARAVIELLQPFDFNIVVHDPYISPEQAASMGCRLVSLEECFATSHIVSNHLPNLPSTVELITGDLLSRLPPRATFINSGRGKQVQQEALFRLCAERSDLTAILDVTDPSPLPRDSIAWNLSNIELSSHIAGSHGNETDRMVNYLCHCFDTYELNHKVPGEITLDTWEQMA